MVVVEGVIEGDWGGARDVDWGYAREAQKNRKGNIYPHRLSYEGYDKLENIISQDKRKQKE